jgi:sec-independent protein translocase protein TatB
MFGISFSELIIIAFAALLIIGPKDLPMVLRKMGKAVGKIKKLGDEFMDALNAEIDEPKKYVRDLKGNLQQTYDIEDLIDKKKGDI